MSKNFQAIHSGGNPSSALNQGFFLKAETVKGTPAVPTGSDFFYTLEGGSISFSQPKILSPHRSGRHANNIIREKTVTEWSFPTYFNLDTAVGYATSVDTAIRALWKNLLGRETDTTTSYDYDSATDPANFFTLLQNLDHMAVQSVGCYVESATASLPGDGQAQITWNGRGKNTYHAGIGLSTTDNDTGNTITLQAGEGSRFDVGAMVMLVEADGVTRSADTPDGSPRFITGIVGDVVTVDGAVLADADGSAANVYLCYYEPATPVAIDEPQTGLEGSLTINTLSGIDCMRSAEITWTNNHEPQDFCFGKSGLGDNIMTPGGRLECMLTMELNLDATLAEWMKRVRNFEAHDIQLVLGDSTGRHIEFDMPKVIFDVPAITVPATGSVPVSFEGTCLQTALDAADEVTVRYK